MQQDSSVAMTAQALRSWQQTRLGVALQTEHTTGARFHSTTHLTFLDSPTGSTTSSASTTAASGPTTATTTSNTGPPVTAGVTSHPAQVSESLTAVLRLNFSQDYCLVSRLNLFVRHARCGVWRSPLHNIWWRQLLLQWQRRIHFGDLRKEIPDNPRQSRAGEWWATEGTGLLKVTVPCLNNDH